MRSDSYKRQVAPDREAWRAEQPQKCMVCEVKERDTWPGLQVHEMLRKSQAPNNWGHRWNYLLTCQSCHDDVLATEPHSRQLARKIIHDGRHFDLRAFVEARNPNALEYVTLSEVLTEVWELRNGRRAG